MREQLVHAIADMQEEEAERLAGAWLSAGGDPNEVLAAARQGLEVVGQRYEAREYYLPELIIAGDVMKAITALVKPRLAEAGAAVPRGRVLIGTVAGDIHDIGKDIVTFMLEINNFAVVDLGVDVPAVTFVDRAREVRPDVVALSGFLTLAFDQMRATVQALADAGLRDTLKVMIGGAIMGDDVRAYVGADAYGPDAQAAVRLASAWTA